MATTIAEYQRLATDTIKIGIADTIVKESPVLSVLPFHDISGNAYLYNWEEALAGASWYQVGDLWVESPPTWAQRTTALKILGGDVDVDKFAQQTLKDQNLKAAVMVKKSKAIAYEFNKQFIRGGTSTQVDANSLKGLMLALAECESTSTTDWEPDDNDQIFSANVASATLSLDMLDQVIDAVQNPNAIIMSKRSRRKLNSLLRAAGTNLDVKEGKAGEMVTMWGDLRIYTEDWIPDNIQDGDGADGTVTIASWNPATTRAGALDNSVIFVCRLSEDGVSGVHNGGLTTEELGTVPNKDAERTRIKWYCNVVNFSKKSLAGLINFTDGL